MYQSFYQFVKFFNRVFEKKREGEFWKTLNTFYSKNPPLGISFEGDISESGC